MESRLIRPLLALIFLISVGIWLTFWSQVGGQYHLDLMFWPWKFGLTLAAALLTTAIVREFYRSDPAKPFAVSRKAVLYCVLLVFVIATAGIVTYYYHMNEPADEDNGGDVPTTATRLRDLPEHLYQTRQALAETIGLPVEQPNAL